MHETIIADPLNEDVTTRVFTEKRQALMEKVESYRRDPFYLRIIIACLFIIPVIIYFFVIMSSFSVLYILVLLAAGLVFYYAHVMELQREVILHLLCERYNWVFDPEKNHIRALRFSLLFPDVFDRGDPKLKHVDNQIWGSAGEKKPISFWSGTFHYEVNDKYDEWGIKRPDDSAEAFLQHTGIPGIVSNLLTGRSAIHATAQERNSTAYDKQVFILELGRFIPSSFSLVTYGKRRDMETESVHFNRKFKILLHTHSKESKQHIIQALSPSVQVRLIDLAETLPIDCITFQHNCMVVLFKQEVWHPKHTNFFKSVTIDERDVRLFDDVLNDMIALPLEMHRYLD